MDCRATYVYNTDQLTADGVNTLTYDANGNRTNGSYDTDPGNRLVTDGVWTYTYDTEGNLTKKSKGLSNETWTYGCGRKASAAPWAKNTSNHPVPGPVAPPDQEPRRAGKITRLKTRVKRLGQR